MSFYGERWNIDGITAGPIQHFSLSEAEYTILFEREYASLEQIESINWEHPTIMHLREDDPNETGLPNGYGFDVVSISYDHNRKTYKVKVKIAEQYLGNVSGFQAVIDGLKLQIAEKDGTIAARDSQITVLQVSLANVSEQLREADDLAMTLYESQLEGEVNEA